MQVIIAGGRDYRLTQSDYTWLNTLMTEIPITGVILGRGRGVDEDAEWWARRHHLFVTPFPAEWERYGKAAGPIRNEQMADEAAPDGGCILFQGNRGTDDMRRRAKKHGLQIWERQGNPIPSVHTENTTHG